MRPPARRAIRRANKRLGVAVREDALVESIEAGAVVLADGTRVEFDVCLLAMSFAAPDLARESGLAVDPTGRLLVDETLRSVDAPNIIGAGDAVVAPPSVGSHLRMGCAVALPLGGHAAETALHLIRSENPTPLSVGFIMQCISLGRRRGYIQFVRPDDTPRNLHLGGRTGALVKESICKMVVTGPAKERRKPGAYRAIKGPKRSKDATGTAVDAGHADSSAAVS
jgi:NADH dehydrogenase FAD-containing subunit